MTILGADEHMVLSADEYVLYCLYRLECIEMELPNHLEPQMQARLPWLYKQAKRRKDRDQARWRKQLSLAKQRHKNGEGRGCELNHDGGFIYALNKGYIEA